MTLWDSKLQNTKNINTVMSEYNKCPHCNEYWKATYIVPGTKEWVDDFKWCIFCSEAVCYCGFRCPNECPGCDEGSSYDGIMCNKCETRYCDDCIESHSEFSCYEHCSAGGCDEQATFKKKYEHPDYVLGTYCKDHYKEILFK